MELFPVVKRDAEERSSTGTKAPGGPAPPESSVARNSRIHLPARPPVVQSGRNNQPERRAGMG